MKNSQANAPRPACSLCGGQNGGLTACHNGWVCGACTQKLTVGRDQTTQAVRLVQRSQRLRSKQAKLQLSGHSLTEAQAYAMEAEGMLAMDALQVTPTVAVGAGGEVLPAKDHELHDTLAGGGVAAIDASTERLSLISLLGVDVAAMAIDAADAVGAANSLEKMLSHQLAALHAAGMKTLSKATMETDPAQSVRLANLATRLLDTYQRGLLTLKRLRSTGDQSITVQHVHVADGGQAVVGSLQTGRGL